MNTKYANIQLRLGTFTERTEKRASNFTDEKRKRKQAANKRMNIAQHSFHGRQRTGEQHGNIMEKRDGHYSQIAKPVINFHNSGSSREPLPVSRQGASA